MRRSAFFACAILAGAFWANPASAQPPAKEDKAPLNLRPSGSEFFRGLLNFRKMEPVTPELLQQADYSRLVVVVMGLPSLRDPRAFDPSGVVVRTLQAGGSVLIAVDGSGPLSGYFPNRRSSLALTGEVAYQPDETLCLNGQGWCSYAKPTSPSLVDQLIWEREKAPRTRVGALFAGLDRVATNVPAVLRHSQPSRYDRYKLAGFPKGARVDGPDGELLDRERALAVGSSGVEPDEVPFRCLVVADPSIFSNQMMAVNLDGTGPGTDNLAFANNVALYLRGPDERSKCLYVEYGRVVTKFDDVQFAESQLPEVPPLPIPPLPSPLDPAVQSKITDFVNNRIDNWETNDGPNGAIVGRPPRDRRFVDAARFLGVLAAVLVVFLVFSRFWRSRHTPEVTPIPTDAGRVASSGPPGSIARRKEELLQGGNYTGPIHEYIRALFASRGLVMPEGKPPLKLPAVEITGRGATTLRTQLQTLWTMLVEPKPKPISFARWKELEPMIDAVKRAADENRWQFVPGAQS